MTYESTDSDRSRAARHHRRVAIRPWLRAGLWCLTLLTTGVVHAAVCVPTATGSPSADLPSRSDPLVRVLIGPTPARALEMLPPDFAAVMGYRPQLIDGYPANPTGSCSSPISLPSKFEPLCKTHDFGYDILRYAERTGSPMGAWARLSLDRMLITRMRASCSDLLCSMAAETARTGLAVNTWRQHGRAPTAHESVPQIAASTTWKALVAERADTEATQ